MGRLCPFAAARDGGEMNELYIEQELQKGLWEPNQRDLRPGNRGQTCLHKAASNNRLGVVQILLKGKVNPNAKDLDGKTPLHEAASRGHDRVVTLLLSFGGDHLKLDNLYQNALHKACFENEPDVVRSLLLHNSRQKDKVVWKRYIDAEDKLGWTPLHFACRQGGIASSRILLESGAKVNTVNKFGSTPLHDAYKSGEMELVKLLIAKGADRSTLDNRGKTPAQYQY